MSLSKPSASTVVACISMMICIVACDASDSTIVRSSPSERQAPTTPSSASSGDEELRTQAGGRAADKPLAVSRSHCASAACEITFSFTRDMVSGPRNGRTKAVDIAFDPPQAGRFRWKSAREMVFRPKAKGLAFGHRFTITIASATARDGSKLAKPWVNTLQVPYFEAAGKVAYWPIIEGQPRFVAFLNGRSNQIGKGPIYLLYDQPVSPKRVRKLTRLSAGDRALPVSVNRPKSIVHAYSGQLDTRLVVAIQSNQLPKHGRRVALQYPKRLERVPAIDKREFIVHTDFTLKELHADNESENHRVPLQARLRLVFNSPVSAGTLSKALSIEPKPEDFGVSWVWSGEAILHARLDPGVTYALQVSRDLRDELGNRLDAAKSMTFTAHDLAPRLEVPKEPMLLERGHARVPIKARNVSELQARLHVIDSPSAYIRMLARGPSACTESSTSHAMHAAGAWSFANSAALNTIATHEAALADAARSDAFGCISFNANGVGSRAKGAARAGVLIQQTGLGATAKVYDGRIDVFTSRLANAMPVRDAKVALMSERGEVLARARSNQSGLARLNANGISARAGMTDQSYVLIETKTDRAVVHVSTERLSQPWQYGIRGSVADMADLSAAVFTDRGVYRPKETVHIKVMVRDPETGRTPSTKPVSVRVADPRGQQVSTHAISLDAYGSGHVDVELEDAAPVGRYTIQVGQGEHMTTRWFRVEEYRVPTFQVSVDADTSWAIGDTSHALVSARYLHGGDLAARAVRYTVSRERVSFNPHGFAGFVFRTPDNPDIRSLDGIINRGETRLDGNGDYTVALQPNHPSKIGPMRYVVEAAVTDVDRQVYKGRRTQVVHPASAYIGVRPTPARILAAGDRIDVPVVAVTPGGNVQAGMRAALELVRIDYHTTARLANSKSVEVTNRPVEQVVDRCSVRTKKRAVSCSLRVPKAGSYKVVASARDAQKKLVQSGFSFSAGGRHTIAWPRYQHERVDVITDKPHYRPGDVARLMVQSPFARARGLLTLERGQLVEHRFFDIAGDSPIIDVPITDTHAPNVFASVTLLRPRVHTDKDATGFETGAPAFRMGYAELLVTPASQKLQVAITAAKQTVPGARMSVDIQVRDAAGQPAEGRATIMVVDEAVLGLTGYKTPDPVAQIFARRPLGVRTLASMLDLPYSRRARHERIFPGGDGGAGFGLDPMAAEMRSLFQSTAYWNPDVQIGTNGEARVEFDLPDGTTTYRIMAIAAGQGGTAGSSDARVVVDKPLMVQPVLPRFVYPGDAFRAEARVFNTTREPAKVRVVADIDGVVHGAAEAAGTRTMTVTVPAGDSATVGLPVKVVGTKTVRVRLAASVVGRSGGHRDAIEVSLPVLNPGSRRRMVEKRAVNDTANVSIELPKQRIPGSERFEVRVSQSRLGQLKESVDYLMGYPNGCIEQTTSRAYPLLVLRDLLPEMGVTVDMAKLQEYAEAGVKRLLSFQTSSGGLSYWPGSDEPHAFGTAFGATALIEAQHRGYDVPDAAIKRMTAYLLRALGEGRISEEMPHGGMADGDTRALFAMTLGRMGAPQDGHIATLWRNRDKLSAFGLSFLAVAANELPNRNQALVTEMLALVRSKAKEQTDEAYYEGARDGGWSMGSPLRTHAGALLAYAVSAPGHEMQKKLLTGLLARQHNGSWGNTQENVFGIMAVSRAVKAPAAGVVKADASAPELSIRLNGTPKASKPMGTQGIQAMIGHRELAGTPGQAVTHTVEVRNRATTPAHVTIRAEYDVELDKHTMAARQSGFEVSRSYEQPTGEALDPKAMKLGSLVLVRVRVSTSTKHNYVAIHDKLPAGLEPLNANLATTETVQRGRVSPMMARAANVLSYSEIRDAGVAFYANDLPRGTYEFTYLARAITPGTFLRPAATADAMYQPNVSGASEADFVTVQ